MRNTFLKLSLLAAGLSPVVAHATVMDQLVISSAGGPTYSFILPDQPPISDEVNFPPFVGITLSGIQDTTTVGLVSTVNPDVVSFFTPIAMGGFYDVTTALTLSTVDLFNNSLTAPQFVLGSGTTPGTSPTGAAVTYNYSISSYTAPATTPEPSSILLIGTGALGVVGSLRRRLFA